MYVFSAVSGIGLFPESAFPLARLLEQHFPRNPLIVGGVEIEGGKCCVGGVAGEEIDIKVRFTAIGLELPTTEMRYVTSGYSLFGDQLDTAPWEPYVEDLTFSYKVPTNWTGFHIHVQYRDALGNVSPVYTDDISVEGMPPPTPSPGG